MKHSNRIFGTCLMLTAIACLKPDLSTLSGQENDQLETIKQISRRAGSPIRFEEKTGEYQLILPNVGTDGRTNGFINFPIQYCPWTGVKLPESRRQGLFLKLDETEVEKWKDKLKNSDSFEKLANLIGKPNIGHTNSNNSAIEVHYSQIANSFTLIAKGTNNLKGLVFIYAPKPKK